MEEFTYLKCLSFLKAKFVCLFYTHQEHGKNVSFVSKDFLLFGFYVVLVSFAFFLVLAFCVLLRFIAFF